MTEFMQKNTREENQSKGHLCEIGAAGQDQKKSLYFTMQAALQEHQQ